MGLVGIAASLFWPRNEEGSPKHRRSVLVVGLTLALLTMIPGLTLHRYNAKIVANRDRENDAGQLQLESELNATVSELQQSRVELASLQNSASAERRIDAEREAAAERDLMQMGL